jgi:hypothetical protein
MFIGTLEVMKMLGLLLPLPLPNHNPPNGPD